MTIDLNADQLSDMLCMAQVRSTPVRAEATRNETGFHSGYPECVPIASEITAKTYFVHETTLVMKPAGRTDVTTSGWLW